MKIDLNSGMFSSRLIVKLSNRAEDIDIRCCTSVIFHNVVGDLFLLEYGVANYIDEYIYINNTKV